ncbi:hypothetical protein FOL47_001868 [Perkinsus chesapeaki]|uniref:Uncharacterized protein n=1 Tax=Perkinsus chesapeaki TaxID=330153 RepID=A0A7J6MGI5_PERCH|nr:hypothetical protein FOL47_001868 [Perkinsus chesapeaki]
MAFFSIDRGGEAYEAGPFILRRDPVGIPRGQIHAFPRDHSDERQAAWLAGVEKVCPGLTVAIDDLRFFYVTREGNLETKLRGQFIKLEREWLPLSPGRYLLVSESSLILKYNIHPDHAAHVRFGCESGDTGYMLYNMVSQGPGKEYKLTAYPGPNTVDDLITKFKTVCPEWDSTL